MSRGTMSPVSMQSAAGQFGLKKRVNLPPSKKEELEVEFDEKVVEEITKIEETADKTSTPVEEVVEEAVKQNQVEVADADADVQLSEEEPSEKNEQTDGVKESFVCPVCGKEFSKKIALAGHMRGPCGKK